MKPGEELLLSTLIWPFPVLRQSLVFVLAYFIATWAQTTQVCQTANMVTLNGQGACTYLDSFLWRTWLKHPDSPRWRTPIQHFSITLWCTSQWVWFSWPSAIEPASTSPTLESCLQIMDFAWDGNCNRSVSRFVESGSSNEANVSSLTHLNMDLASFSELPTLNGSGHFWLSSIFKLLKPCPDCQGRVLFLCTVLISCMALNWPLWPNPLP